MVMAFSCYNIDLGINIGWKTGDNFTYAKWIHLGKQIGLLINIASKKTALPSLAFSQKCTSLLVYILYAEVPEVGLELATCCSGEIAVRRLRADGNNILWSFYKAINGILL